MKKHLVIFSIGVLMIITATLTMLRQETKAATNYSSTWTVEQWRNATADNTQYRIPGFQTSVTLSLGPAKWKVSGSVGGVTYDETWEATSFQETISTDSATTGRCSNTELSRVTFSTGALVPPADFTIPAVNISGFTLRYGLYGGSLVFPPRSNAHASSLGSACNFSSIPTSWTVTGTINN